MRLEAEELLLALILPDEVIHPLASALAGVAFKIPRQDSRVVRHCRTLMRG